MLVNAAAELAVLKGLTDDELERMQRELNAQLAAHRAQRYAWWPAKRLAAEARALGCVVRIACDDSLPHGVRIDFVREDK